MIVRSELDRLLSQIEYPGEEAGLISAYLRTRRFTTRVFDQTRSLAIVSRQHIVWTIVVLFALLVAVALGLDPALGPAGSSVFATILYLSLGVVLTAAAAGWALTLDPFRASRLVGREGQAEAEADGGET